MQAERHERDEARVQHLSEERIKADQKSRHVAKELISTQAKLAAKETEAKRLTDDLAEWQQRALHYEKGSSPHWVCRESRPPSGPLHEPVQETVSPAVPALSCAIAQVVQAHRMEYSTRPQGTTQSSSQQCSAQQGLQVQALWRRYVAVQSTMTTGTCMNSTRQSCSGSGCVMRTWSGR